MEMNVYPLSIFCANLFLLLTITPVTSPFIDLLKKKKRKSCSFNLYVLIMLFVIRARFVFFFGPYSVLRYIYTSFVDG